VTIINLDDDEEKTYCIVGQDEADIKAGKISIGSPIARALIAKSEGDEVKVTTPGGVIHYEIAKVEHIA
jgi:transcription elongation factor GreA